jgi:thiamine-phosphate pyrophosphorylase
MAESRILYYITDRKAFASDEPTRRRRLLEKIAEATAAGIDYIQLREKDLTIRDLESLAGEAVSVIRKLRNRNRELKTALLINSRIDVALAVNADGVHLPAQDISPREAQSAWKSGAAARARELSPQSPQISISCHSLEEVTEATNMATLALFSPIFQKKDAPELTPTGLRELNEACGNKIPVLALGGITLQNAHSCFQAGAAGIAAIRLFQENDIGIIARTLRS